MGSMQHTPTVVYQDNQSTIVLVGNGQTSRRTKHIKVHFYYTHDKISDNTIKIEYCPTNKMIANRLTKALAPKQFVRLQDGITMPRKVAGALGESIRTTTRRRPSGRPVNGGNEKGAKRTDINEHGGGGDTSLPKIPHQCR